MREPTNPMKMRKAKKQFTGTCGHTIEAGNAGERAEANLGIDEVLETVDVESGEHGFLPQNSVCCLVFVSSFSVGDGSMRAPTRKFS